MCAEAEAKVVVGQSGGVQDAHPNSRGTASLRQSRDDSNAADEHDGDAEHSVHAAQRGLGGDSASTSCGCDRRVNRGTSPAEHHNGGAGAAIADTAQAGALCDDEDLIDTSDIEERTSGQPGECDAAAREMAECDLDESMPRNDDDGNDDEDAQVALMAVVLAGIACNTHTVFSAELEQSTAGLHDVTAEQSPEGDEEERTLDEDKMQPEEGAGRLATDGIGDIACLAELVRATQAHVGDIGDSTPAVDPITWVSLPESKHEHESGDKANKSESCEEGPACTDGAEAESARGVKHNPVVAMAEGAAPEGASEAAVLMSGKLRADGARKWKWAVLTATQLRLFKSESDAASGRAARTLETRLGAARASRDGAPEVFTFFPNVGRSIKLRAKTSTEAAEWVRVLSACCSGMVLEAIQHVLEADGRRASGVPRAVEECAEYLRARGGLEREGIFRVSGSIGKMAALQAALDKRAPIDAGEYGPCEVSQALKRLLARLPEPLMTHAGWLQLVGQCPAASRRRVRKVVAALPDPNKRLLRFLVEDVFLGVLAHTAVNKMTAESLSIVVAPCILRPSDDALAAMRLTPEEHRDLANRSARVVRMILEGHKRILA
eukprot:m51a1_g13266 putative rho gtpase-activating protein 27 isoform x1 (608) ;mRNA; r:802-4293